MAEVSDLVMGQVDQTRTSHSFRWVRLGQLGQVDRSDTWVLGPSLGLGYGPKTLGSDPLGSGGHKVGSEPSEWDQDQGHRPMTRSRTWTKT